MTERWRVCTMIVVVALGVVGCGASGEERGVDVSAATARSLGLTRTLPTALRRVCSDLAAYAPPDARTCPPLVPAGPVEVVDAKPFSRRREYRDGWQSDFESRSLMRLGVTEIDAAGGHWRFDVAWSAAVRRLMVERGVERPVNADGARSDCHWGRLASERVEACQVLPYEQGGGVNGGHVVYVWPHGAATYVISLHGRANGPRARALMVALIAAA